MTTVSVSGAGDVVRLESPRLRVEVAPETGGDILAVVDPSSAQDVLWKAPWARRTTASNVEASSAAHWIERCPGGWQLLLPNAGEACEVDGVAHGFHGEAAVTRWSWTEDEGGITLSTELLAAPLRVERHLVVEDATLAVSTTVLASGTVPVDFVAVEHIGFGSDLLAGGVTVTSKARLATVDERYDPPGNRFEPGGRAPWPQAAGASGERQDLRRPQDGTSGFCFLSGFSEGGAAILRDDHALGAELTWDATSLPAAWLWQELGASPGWPWFGRARVIGIEPATSFPADGLAAAREAGAAVHLEAGGTWRTWVRLRLLTDSDEIARMAEAASAEQEEE